jgi:hypothetical protein
MGNAISRLDWLEQFPTGATKLRERKHVASRAQKTVKKRCLNGGERQLQRRFNDGGKEGNPLTLKIGVRENHAKRIGSKNEVCQFGTLGLSRSKTSSFKNVPLMSS